MITSRSFTDKPELAVLAGERATAPRSRDGAVRVVYGAREADVMRALVTPLPAVRLLDSAGRPARFLDVTADPLDCGAACVWPVEEVEVDLPDPSPLRD